MTLQEIIEHFFNLYGRRNRIFLPSLIARVNFLNLAIGDLQEAVRKGANNEKLIIALARVVARIFCVAEHFVRLPLVVNMVSKYPAGYCSYCQRFPCICQEKRPDAQLVSAISQEQIRWALSDWCRHFARLYGEKNRERGIDNILSRLFKEVSELMSLVAGIPQTNFLDEIEKEFALELSDALAWTIAVANFLNVDLEEAVLSRYGHGCWNCRQNPCVCGHFSVEPVKWQNIG